MKIVISEDQYRRLIMEENSCDLFSNKTNLPDYDDILFKKTPRVLENSKGRIIKMSPESYLRFVARLQGTTYEQQLSYIEQKKVKRLESKLNDGDLFDIPVIDYNRKWQEGRHRAYVAQSMGCDKIPVLVVINVKDSWRKWVEEKYYDGESDQFRLEDIRLPGNQLLPDLKQDEKGYYMLLDARWDYRGKLVKLIENNVHLMVLINEQAYSITFPSIKGRFTLRETAQYSFDSDRLPENLSIKNIPLNLMELIKNELKKHVENVEKFIEDDYEYYHGRTNIDELEFDELMALVYYFMRNVNVDLKRIYNYVFNIYKSIIHFEHDKLNFDWYDHLKNGYSISFSIGKDDIQPYVQMKLYIDKSFNGNPYQYQTAFDVILDLDDGILGDFDYTSIESLERKYSREPLDGKLVESYMSKYPFENFLG